MPTIFFLKLEVLLHNSSVPPHFPTDRPRMWLNNKKCSSFKHAQFSMVSRWTLLFHSWNDCTDHSISYMCQLLSEEVSIPCQVPGIAR